MNYYKFECPHCTQSVEAPEEMIGSMVDCPTCKKSIVIPHAEQPNQQGSHSIPAPEPTVPTDIKKAKPYLPSGAISFIIGISVGLVFWLIYKDPLIDRLPFIGICILVVIVLGGYLLPTIIAFRRDHHYRFIIMGINIVLGVTGIGYVVAFAWAVWPSKTSVFDPLIASPTSIKVEDGKQIYSRWGEYKQAFGSTANPTTVVPPPLKTERTADDYESQLRVLAKLKEDGVITAQECDHKKGQILDL